MPSSLLRQCHFIASSMQAISLVRQCHYHWFINAIIIGSSMQAISLVRQCHHHWFVTVGDPKEAVNTFIIVPFRLPPAVAPTLRHLGYKSMYNQKISLPALRKRAILITGRLFFLGVFVVLPDNNLKMKVMWREELALPMVAGDKISVMC